MPVSSILCMIATIVLNIGGAIWCIAKIQKAGKKGKKDIDVCQ